MAEANTRNFSWYSETSSAKNHHDVDVAEYPYIQTVGGQPTIRTFFFSRFN